MDLILSELLIRNFRCFRECKVALHPKLAVVVADNGRGKSTVLDACAAILAKLVDEITGSRQAAALPHAGIYQGNPDQQPTDSSTRIKLVGSLSVGGTAGSIVRYSRKKGHRISVDSKSQVSLVARQILAHTNSGSRPNSRRSPLPVMAYYGSSRYGQIGRLRIRRGFDPRDSRHEGYRWSMEPEIEPDQFGNWFQTCMASIRDKPITGATGELSVVQHVTAVKEAVNRLVQGPTGWGVIDWDFERQCVVAEHPVQGTVPLRYLSSGVRQIISLAADLASRCVRLNPHLGEEVTLKTPGVVLIDEVDLHLHPSWQQLIVGLLQEAFPRVQFILSTHSPQVLSTVNAESIRVIKLCDGDGQIETPRFQTRGVESADVLARIMGVDPVPQVKEAEDLSRYRSMIEAGTHETPNGMSLRESLVAHFGQEHPLILDCDRLIRFSKLKTRPREGRGHAPT